MDHVENFVLQQLPNIILSRGQLPCCYRLQVLIGTFDYATERRSCFVFMSSSLSKRLFAGMAAATAVTVRGGGGGSAGSD